MNERNQYNKSKAFLIAITAVILIAVVVITAIFVSKQQKGKKYYESIRKAETYIEEHDYAAAILEYEKAIKIKDSDPEIYQSLAVLYDLEGDTEMALEVAQKGYDKTGDDTLNDMVKKIKNNNSTGLAFKEGSTVLVTLENREGIDGIKIGTLKPMFRRNISEICLNYSFEDFTDNYGEAEITSDDTYTVANFGNLKVYYPKETELSGYSGTAIGISFDNIKDIFDNYKKGAISFTDVGEALEGVPEIVYDEYLETNCISIVYLGCEIRIECDSDGNIDSENAKNIVISLSQRGSISEKNMAENNEEEYDTYLGSASGKIKDATTGSGLGKVHLEFREGRDNHNGEIVYECDTDNNGNYYAELDEGSYCVKITKSGYIETYTNIKIFRNTSSSGNDAVISSKLKEGEIRIVLEWGSTPIDLDSHLEGKTSNGTSIHTWFTDKIAYSDGAVAAELDVDDINGYGPETTTIHDTDGVYEFYVIDFLGIGSMPQEGAKVTIYLPDNTSQTINIKTSATDKCLKWNVLKIDHGEVTIINSYETVSEDSLNTYDFVTGIDDNYVGEY